jgi:hypothetical protein
MNRQQFYQYLENPQKLNNESLRHLNELATEYPYFQAGRMLLVQNLHLLDHIRFNQELKTAAAHIPDRRKLYLLVHEPPTYQTPAAIVDEPKPIEIESTISETIELSSKSEIIENESLPQTQEVIPETISAPVNYFDVSDVVDLSDGLTIDFSSSKPQFEKNEPTEPVVLPTADLLDYELSNAPGYLLEDEQPEPFDPQHNRSFSDWLKAMRATPTVVPEPELPASEPIKLPKNKQMDIIDSFLQTGNKRIVPKKEPVDEIVDIAAPSIEENEALMTETLANIHIKQKHYHKAIEIFEKLSLKYPEKSIYFAARIKELERLITNL